MFCFELTESAAIANLAHAEVHDEAAARVGLQIALDDFGTGLSSLAYLRALPVDMLKIDGSFVRDMLKDPRAESMVQAIAQLARSMNLITVAEYVETDEIRLRVATLGVDYGQGFAIARPVPFADAIRDLPTYASAAKLRCRAKRSRLGAEDDTISADLHQQLLDAGIDLAEDDDTQGRMEKILSGYDHSESTLYQRKLAQLDCRPALALPEHRVELLHLLVDFVLHLDRHLVELLMRFDIWIYAIMFLVIFAETGFVVTPFLPGDSLLFGLGALAAIDTSGTLSPPVLACC